MELMSPKWTCIRTGLVISFAVGTLEGVGARIAFFGFQSRWVDFVVSFTTSTKLPVVFRFVRTIALYTFRSLNATWEGRMSPLPAVLALGNSQIHVCASNCRNVVTYIEASIDEHFSIFTTLDIPDVNSDYGHVQFGRDFDNSRFYFIFFLLILFFHLFYFWFLFSLFFILNLAKECNITLYMTVIQVTKGYGSVLPITWWSHNHMTWRSL